MLSFFNAGTAFLLVANIYNVCANSHNNGGPSTPCTTTTTSAISSTSLATSSSSSSTNYLNACSIVPVSPPSTGVTCHLPDYKPSEVSIRSLSNVDNKYICLLACFFLEVCQSITYNDSAKTCDLFDVTLGHSTHWIHAGLGSNSYDKKCYEKACSNKSPCSTSLLASTYVTPTFTSTTSTASTTFAGNERSTTSSTGSSTSSPCSAGTSSSQSSRAVLGSGSSLSTGSEPYSTYVYSTSTFTTHHTHAAPPAYTNIYTITKCPATMTDCSLNPVTTEIVGPHPTAYFIDEPGGPAAEGVNSVAVSNGSGNGYGSGSISNSTIKSSSPAAASTWHIQSSDASFQNWGLAGLIASLCAMLLTAGHL